MPALCPLALAVALAAGISPPKDASRVQPPQPIRIGVVLATTGHAEQYGDPAWKGAQLAAEEWNRRAGGTRPKIELVFRDSLTEPGRAARAMNELGDQGIPAVIGDVSSDTALAMAAVAERRGMVMVSPGASAAALSSHGRYVFRNWHSDEHEARQDAQYAYNVLKWKNVVVMYVDEAYGRGLADEFTEHFQELGGQVTRVGLDPKRANFREELAKLRKTKSQGIFLAAYSDHITQILDQKMEYGIRLPVLAVQAFDNVNPKLVAVNYQPVWFSSVKSPPATRAVADFRRAYKTRWGTDPTLCSDSGYDAVKILAEVTSNGAVTAPQIVDALKQIDHAGAAGRTKFDEDHRDVEKQIFFSRVIGGKVVPAAQSRHGGLIPAPARNLWDRFVSASGSYLKPAAVAVVTASALTFMALMHRRLFMRGRWLHARWEIFRFRPSRRARVRFGTVDDYVHIATKLREHAAAECRASKAKSPTLVIHAYTLQFPQDWPLFMSEEGAHIASPIDRYFRDFQKFIANSKNAGYGLCIRRVIVIEHAGTDYGRQRLDELTKVVDSSTFDRYIDLLHEDESDAYYYEQDGAWPNDVADAVFYGIVENGKTRWLSAVTTNYRGNGGGVLAMRLHKLGKLKPIRHMHMPFPNMESLEQFAEQAGDTDLDMKPLSSLKNVRKVS